MDSKEVSWIVDPKKCPRFPFPNSDTFARKVMRLKDWCPTRSIAQAFESVEKWSKDTKQTFQIISNSFTNNHICFLWLASEIGSEPQECENIQLAICRALEKAVNA